MDIDIFSFPGGAWFRYLFALMISTLRAPRVKQRYQQLGGISPLLEYTQKQAACLEQVLVEKGLDISVEVGMSYSRPFVSDAVRELVNKEVREIIALPLYPQYSASTTGSSFKVLKTAIEKAAPDMAWRKVSSWCDHPGYHDVLAKRISDCINPNDDNRQGLGLLFLAHSLPVKFVQKGDPYVDHVMITLKGVLEALKKRGTPDLPWFLGYQSRVGPVKWVGPTVRESMNDMRSRGLQQVVVVPISFVSDHLETLYEIDLQYKSLGLELGFQRFERIASLNDSEDFIRVLADLVMREVGR